MSTAEQRTAQIDAQIQAREMGGEVANDGSQRFTVAGEIQSTQTTEPLRNLEDRLKVLNLQYPIAGKDNIPLPKYLMNIFIYKQTKEGAVRALATSSELDAQRYGRIAGNRDVVDIVSGTAAAGAFGVGRGLAGATLKPGVTDTVTSTAGTLAAINSSEVDPNRKTFKQPLSYISLYMPESLVFTDQQNFQPLSLTDAMGISGLLAQSEFLGPEQQARLGELAGLFNAGFSEAAVFNQGYGLNPQLILLYKGPTNRQFVFQFKFVPRNADEGAAILDIIRTLRYHATPNFETAVTSRYVIPPSEFEIEFLVREPDGSIRSNDKLPRLGQSVLTNVDVNYAPSGYFSAHKDGMSTEIQMQLTFTEAVLLSKNDIVKLGY